MKKLIVSMLCAIKSVQLLTGMDPGPQLDKKMWKKTSKNMPQEISTAIVQRYIVTEYHRYAERSQVAQHMRKFCRFNKSMRDFLNNPQTIRVIINNLVSPFTLLRNHDIAILLGTRGSNNYIKQSNKLHNEFSKLTSHEFSQLSPDRKKKPTKSDIFNSHEIDTLVSAGADINCYNLPETNPILFHVLNHQEKLQQALHLGANVNAIDHQHTPLDCAIHRRNLSAISLLLSCNPQNKCVDAAVHKNSRSVVRLLIKEGNLTQHQLIEGLRASVAAQKKELIPLFAQADPGVRQLFNLSLHFAQQINNITNDPHQQKNALFLLTPHLCKLSDKDLQKVKKTCRRTPTSSDLARSIAEHGRSVTEEKKRTK